MAICTVTLKNGRKRYFARLADPTTGQKVCSKRFNRKKDAEQAEAEMKVALYRGESLERRKDVLFAEFAAELMEQCTAGEHTRKEYRGIDAWFSAFFGRKTVRQITTQECERAVASLANEKAPNTVQKYVVRLRYVFRRAVAYGYITTSPADAISNKPKAVNVREIQTLDADEIQSLLDLVDDYWRPLFTLWLVTGLRRSEIFGLDVSCLDFRDSRIHVRQQLKDGRIVGYTKNRKPRAISVSSEILDLLREHIEATDYVDDGPRLVFPSKAGRRVNYSNFNRDVFKPLVAMIGRPSMVTHDLRHTFASQALSQGVNIKTLQLILGHSDASLTLNRYSHLIPSDARIAAEKMADFLLHEEPMTLIGHSKIVPLHVDEVA